MLMSSEEFWNLIHRYDASIFPVQFAFSIVAIVLIVFIAKKPSAKLNRLVNFFLMLCYLWIGIIFFLGFNRELSAQMHYFQPVLIFIIALLFGLDIFMKNSNFQFPTVRWHRGIVLFFMVYSIVGYPVIGWLLGHPYSVQIAGGFSIWVPIVGVYPCPTTILSIALLGAALPQGDKKVMIPLLFWALSSIFGPPVRNYGVYEDIGLFMAGIYGLLMLITSFRQKSNEK